MNTDNKHSEGHVTEMIEDKTAAIPSTVYLTAAIAAMTTSLALKCLKKPHTALFVGQWAAPFLLLGIYNKIVKTSGHDQQSNEA